MKKQRCTEEQIIAAMKEQEAWCKSSRSLPQARLFTTGKPSLAAWRSPKKRLKALEEKKNAKLKKLLAEEMLDVTAFRELLSKNVWSAPSVQGFATSRMTVPVA